MGGALRFTLALAISLLAAARPVLAYRPFESTDASVAEESEFEVEFGYLEFAHDDGQNFYGPNLRLNYGFAKDFEISLEGTVQLYASHARRDLEILDPEMSLKYVLIDGPLQEGKVPVSLAVEFGLLFPETVEDSSWGFESVLIASWRIEEFTVHLNAGSEWQREKHEPAMVWGLIVERPVANELRAAVEVNGETAKGSPAVVSALAGILWDHRGVTYDAGVRFGLSKAATDLGVSAGLTFKL